MITATAVTMITAPMRRSACGSPSVAERQRRHAFWPVLAARVLTSSFHCRPMQGGRGRVCSECTRGNASRGLVVKKLSVAGVAGVVLLAAPAMGAELLAHKHHPETRRAGHGGQTGAAMLAPGRVTRRRRAAHRTIQCFCRHKAIVRTESDSARLNVAVGVPFMRSIFGRKLYFTGGPSQPMIPRNLKGERNRKAKDYGPDGLS